MATDKEQGKKKAQSNEEVRKDLDAARAELKAAQEKLDAAQARLDAEDKKEEAIPVAPQAAAEPQPVVSQTEPVQAAESVPQASAAAAASAGYAGAQVPPQTPPPTYYYQPTYTQPVVTKDHVAAGLLGIILGSLGIHKFYLGYNTSGFIMLAITILGSILTLGIAGGVMAIIGLIEGILYLTKSQSEFDQMYVFNKREWF